MNKGKGSHAIDFEPYIIADHTIFVMRPGQVHKQVLKAGTTGWLLQFKPAFYDIQHPQTSQLITKAGHYNCYKPAAASFKKLVSVLNYIFQEYTSKKEGYQDIIKANLGKLFIELVRQQQTSPRTSVNSYTQERLEDFLELLETESQTNKRVCLC